MAQEEGIIYVLSNEAMPGLIKIGLTTRDDLQNRLRELYSTGVPLPFKCEYACKVADCGAVESALHMAFSTDRVNPKREFFKMTIDRVIPLLELFKVEDATNTVENELNQDVSSQEKTAIQEFVKRRPNLNFDEMGIPIGSTLVMDHADNEYIATVVSSNKVKYNDEEYSLSRLTAILINSTRKYTQPCPYWTFEGRSLQDIYNETYPYDE